MLKDDIKRYRQVDGLISPDENATPDSTGNGLLYTSLYYVLLYNLRLCTPEDVKEYQEIVKKCAVKYHGITLGLLNRSQTKTDQGSRDDYIGVLVASNLLNVSYRFDIYTWGLHCGRVKNNYNNRNIFKLTWSSWLGRFLDWKYTLKVSCNKEPNLYDRVKYLIAICWASLFRMHDTSSVILFKLIETMPNYNETFFHMLALVFFEYRIVKKWGSFQNVLAHHFGNEDIERGMKHPIARYWK
jgi:hypothetical protein